MGSVCPTQKARCSQETYLKEVPPPPMWPMPEQLTLSLAATHQPCTSAVTSPTEERQVGFSVVIKQATSVDRPATRDSSSASHGSHGPGWAS